MYEAEIERSVRPVREIISSVVRLGSEIIMTAFGTILATVAALVGLWLLAGIAISWIYSGTESNRDRAGRASVLAASTKNAAVVIRPGNQDYQLLLIDFATGNPTRLGNRGYDLSSPYLSPDGQRLLLVRRPAGRFEEAELASCDTVSFVCRSIVKNQGSIHSQVELPGGRILYVSSPYYRGHNGNVRANRNDFWLFDPANGTRKITDFRLYQLYSISATSNAVYFEAVGSSPGSSLVLENDTKSTARSEIFRLPFNPDEGKMEVPSTPLSPLFVKEGIAVRPKASADGLLFAFLRTANRGPYRYDLVIADMTTGKERTISTVSDGYSIPVIVGDAIYARDDVEGLIFLRKVTQGGQRSEVVANINERSVSNLKAVELTIVPGAYRLPDAK